MEGHFDPLPQDGTDFDELHRWLSSEPVTINRLTTGALSVAATLSGNYDGGAGTGWYIAGDGSAFFGADVTFAGDLYSDNWNGTIPVNLATADTGATAGWALDSSVGSAQFEGNIYLGGSLLLDGNGKIATDVSPNERIEITSYANGSLRMWAGSTNETLPFQLSTSDLAGYPRTELYFNSYSGGNRIRLWGGDGASPAAYFGAGGAEEVHLDFGQIWLEPGTAGLPAVAKFGDSNTGIYWPAADQMAITVAGRQAFLFSGMETSAEGGQIEFGPGSGHSTAMFMDRNQDAFRWVIGGVSKLELTGTTLYLAGVNNMYWGANDWINFDDATNAWSFYEDSTLVAQIFRPGSGYGGVNVWFNGVGVRSLRVGASGTGPGGTGRAVYTDT